MAHQSPNPQHRLSSRLILSLAAALTLAIGVAAPASAADWTSPAAVDPMEVDGAPDGPSAAIHAGHLYIAVGGAARRGIFLLTNRSGSWERLRVTHGLDTEPSIAIDAAGQVHIAFVRYRPVDTCAGTGCPRAGTFYVTDRSGDWSVVRAHRGADHLPSIALTPSGRPRIALLDDARRHPVIRLVTRRPHRWATMTIGHHVAADFPRADGPRLAIHGSTAAVVFHGSVGGTQDFLRYVEIEGGRVIARSAVTGLDRALNPDLVIDAAGRPHVAFTQWCHGLWYATRDGHGDWSTTRVAARVAFEYRPSIALAGDAGVAIVAQGGREEVCRAGGSGRIILRSNATGDWATEVLTDGPADHLPSAVTDARDHLRVVFLHGLSAPRVFLTRER